MAPNQGPELFFGLVGAVGSRLTQVVKTLTNSLQRVGYHVEPVRIIDSLHQIEQFHSTMVTGPEDQRYLTYMNAGDQFRQMTGLDDALARLAIGSVREKRKQKNTAGESKDPPISRCAYVFHSLKHPKEIDLLRTIYGPNFYLISAYVPRETRIENLLASIAASNYDSQRESYRPVAVELVKRDENDDNKPHGQKVRDSFPEADLFVDALNPIALKSSIDRFIEILFGHPFHTPNKSEFAMFHAQAAAYRSAALGRQVGAAISTPTGDIIAVGANEVPKFGGGLYWSDDQDDGRDFRSTYDVSDRKKRELLAEVLKRFADDKWFEGGKHAGKSVQALFDHATPLLRSTRLMSLIEFGRAVHAEMAALLDAARRGIAVKGSTLFTTTFPCHDCARHIIAAGVSRVTYIEPYPKSLAEEFHLDAIVIDPVGEVTNKLVFQPFFGIAPRLYSQSFRMPKRKDRQGEVMEWQASIDRLPKLAVTSLAYIDSERVELDELDRKLDAAHLKVASS